MIKTFDTHDVIQQVLQFAETHNIFFRTDTLKLDGEIHRVKTKEDKHGDTSGAYCIYMDGFPAGFIQDWRKGIKENWKYDVSGLDNEQRTYFKNYDGLLLLGEGYATMAKVYELTGYPCVAAMSRHKLDEIAKILRSAYLNSKIIITADDDRATEIKTGHNQGILYAKILFEAHIIQNFTFPVFETPDGGSDWDDYALLYDNEKTARTLLDDLHKVSSKHKNMQSQGKLEVVNAQNLRAMVFPPIKWAVQGVIPSGLSILGGAPKTGKSITALHIAWGIAVGGCVFGCINVEKGDVLYLALEDTQRRLQERMDLSNVLTEKDDISGLDLVTKIEKQHKGGMEYLDWWLSVHSNARLVVIDTLQRFRKELSGKGNVYSEDYEVINEIKSLADKYDVAIMVLHHLILYFSLTTHSYHQHMRFRN